MIIINDLLENNYFIALVIFAVSVLTSGIFKFVIVKKLKEIAKRTNTKYDDIIIGIIDKIGYPFYILIALYVVFEYLDSLQVELTTGIKTILYYIIITIAVYYAVKIINSLIDYGTDVWIQQQKNTDRSIVELLNRIVKGALWLVAIILILSNLGYNVNTLVAGLGIGGIAIAFALQNILGDVFASFSIYLDRPFKAGDYILFGTEEGTVKTIGIKSTRIEAVQGQEIVVSNKSLTDTIVHNYKKMDYRRIVFRFSVSYDTTTAKLLKIPDVLKDIVSKLKMVRFNRAHFFEFGNFGYTFEVVYFVDTGEYNKYMDIQQEINFAINQYFENEGIKIARPSDLIFNKRINEQ